MKKLLIVLGILVALGIAVDIAAREALEAGAEASVEDRRGLRGEVRVEIDGFPFLLALARKEIPSASVTSSRVVQDGVRLRDVRIEMENVAMGESHGDRRTFHVSSGRGTASVTDNEIARLATEAGVSVEIRIEGDTVSVRAAGCAEADPAPQCQFVTSEGISIEADALVVAAPPPLEPVRIALPQVLDGVRFDSVTTRPGRAMLSFTLADIDLSL